MQKNLHIWKIFCTFAPDLGIVPAITYKCFIDMKKECIFKCWAQCEWWYVYKMDFGTFGRRFRVYKGRKRFAHTDFELKQYAICAVVNAVTVGMAGCDFKVVG